MKLLERPAVSQNMSDMLALMKKPEVVRFHPTVAGVAFDIEVEGYVADVLAEIAGREGKSIDDLCTEIHYHYTPGLPLSTGVRAYALNYYRNRVAA